MAYVKIENGIVVESRLSHKNGYVQVDDSVVCGMVESDGVFSIQELEPSESDIKLQGIEYAGVMCSATGEDQNGLLAAEKYIAEYGLSVNFKFVNGSVLVLDAANIAEFKSVWVPFRASFFGNE